LIHDSIGLFGSTGNSSVCPRQSDAATLQPSDRSNVYTKVEIMFTTPDVSGLWQRDFTLPWSAEQAFERFI